MALSRYEETLATLGHMGPKSEGKEVLVPLSESLYAVGFVEDADTVLGEDGELASCCCFFLVCFCLFLCWIPRYPQINVDGFFR